MRLSVLRVTLAVLLFATVASHIEAFHTPKSDALSRLSDVLKTQGFATSTVIDLNYARSMSVVVPGCDPPLRVTPMQLSMEAAPLYETSLLPGDMHRYVFVGQVWSTAEPRAVRLAWLKHKLAPLLGFPIRTRLDTVLFVAAPRNCAAAEKIDWLPLWSS
jgi:hypothetical protein